MSCLPASILMPKSRERTVKLVLFADCSIKPRCHFSRRSLDSKELIQKVLVYEYKKKEYSN